MGFHYLNPMKRITQIARPCTVPYDLIKIMLEMRNVRTVRSYYRLPLA